MAKAEITVTIADLPEVKAWLQRVGERLTGLADHLDTYAGGRHAAVSPALRVLADELTAPLALPRGTERRTAHDTHTRRGSRADENTREETTA